MPAAGGGSLQMTVGTARDGAVLRSVALCAPGRYCGSSAVRPRRFIDFMNGSNTL